MAIDVPIPPWLHGPQTDPANAYIQAFHVGSQLSLEQSRLQQAQINAERDAQLQQQALQANLERAQQEIANRHAYQQSSLGMRQQQLDQAMQRTQAIAAKSAAKFASQQRFAEGLRSGKYKNVEEALFDNPELMTPGTTDQLLRGKTSQEKLHFGEGGLVQRYKEGKIETLVPGTPKYSSQLAVARVNQAKALPGMYKALGELDSSSPEFRKQKQAITEVENFLQNTGGVQGTQGSPGVAGAPGAAPAAQPAPTQYPEGAILKHKDGSRWTVQGGKVVPLTEEAAAVPAAAVAPEGTPTATAPGEEDTTGDEEVD